MEGILDFAERGIRSAKTHLDLRLGAEMLYLGLASSLERLGKRPITTSRERRELLTRLAEKCPGMPRTFSDLKFKLQRECFHQGRCSRPELVKAVATARRFVKCLPPRLPKLSPA